MSLLRRWLTTKHDLTHADLLRCARHLQLSCTSSTSSAGLLAALAEAVDGPELVEPCLKADVGLCADMPWVADPLLEAAYEEMDEDDQLEFGDIRKELQEHRARSRINAWRAKRDLPPLRRVVKKRRRAVPLAARQRKRR